MRIGKKLSVKKKRKKLSVKKYSQSIEQVQDVWSSGKKKDKAISFLENSLEKIIEQSVVEQD